MFEYNDEVWEDRNRDREFPTNKSGVFLNEKGYCPSCENWRAGVKINCIVCNQFMFIDNERFLQRGNFCSKCNGKILANLRAQKVIA